MRYICVCIYVCMYIHTVLKVRSILVVLYMYQCRSMEYIYQCRCPRQRIVCGGVFTFFSPTIGSSVCVCVCICVCVPGWRSLWKYKQRASFWSSKSCPRSESYKSQTAYTRSSLFSGKLRPPQFSFLTGEQVNSSLSRMSIHGNTVEKRVQRDAL